MKITGILAIDDVRQDLDNAECFDEVQSSGLGQFFRASLISDFQSLWLYAGIHTKQYGFYKMNASRFPYAIYYDIQHIEVIIVAVLDMRQNPLKTKSKLSTRG